MIKANELRIGNIVLNPLTGEPCKITAMDISDIENGYKTREGIILSPEILEKYGFIKEIDNFYRLNNSSMIEILFADKGILVASQSVCLNHVKYIHQLQNLYVALTGEELKANM